MLEDGELAPLLVKFLICRAFAVGSQQMAFVSDQHCIEQVRPAQLIEADNHHRLKATRRIQHAHCLSRVDREGISTSDLFGVGVARQKALGKADDLDSFAFGPFKTRNDLGKVAFKISQLGIDLRMTDAHDLSLQK